MLKKNRQLMIIKNLLWCTIIKYDERVHYRIYLIVLVWYQCGSIEKSIEEMHSKLGEPSMLLVP